MRFNPLIFFTFLILVTITGSCDEPEVSRPNFILIQLDDLGYDDLGIHGNNLVESPNIDSMAARSMQFEQFYVNPVCAPTRASLLTGRHFLRTGVSHVHGGKDFLDLEETTIAEVLKEAGYRTGIWGKWHSGHAPGYYPWERGFDEAYMAQLYKHRNSSGLLNGEEVMHEKWADQVITEYAIDFMDRNKKSPFFAYLSYLSIHSPLDTPDSLRNKYIEKGLSYNLATLYGMVEHLDFYIGKLLHAIDSMGLQENTMIMLMSDNGPAVLNNLLTDEDRKIRYVNDLKGQKGNIWENGVRSPLFVHWQGVTRPMIRYDLTDVTDIFPTLASLSGAELPEDNKPLDGLSFCELIQCGNQEERKKVSFNYASRGWPPTKEPWTPEGVLDEYRPLTPEDKTDEKFSDQIISIRKGTYKLMQNAAELEGHPMSQVKYILVDVLADPREELNLYYRMPEVADEMVLQLDDWWQSLLNEPSAFRMPVFTIGGEIGEVSTIPAKAPSMTTDGVQSAFAWLSGWKEPGDMAAYNIRVDDPGLYEVSLHYKGIPRSARIKVTTGKDSVLNSVETYEKAILGSLELSADDHSLVVQLAENPSGVQVFDQLNLIELRRK